jgi:hypothetical protein
MFPSAIAVCACALALVSSKGNDIFEEYVDLIELNHFYDPRGVFVYDQVIFYERSPETGVFRVRAWCLVEDREILNRRPIKNVQSQLYQVDWYDHDNRLLRKIRSHIFRESWTQIDPERLNKQVHEERLRLALVQHPKRLLAIRQANKNEESSPPSQELATLPQQATPSSTVVLTSTNTSASAATTDSPTPR